ncbi:Tar ligand binding domain-containing protein [Paractinoplanes lichenicola]|uniref:Tar ligand binding domain-containing protein n=1 Tax=Paractinoplanes lichenicola TaxID=2802976 RepID=UPI0027DE798F|nr:MCP four helix bundle domain-containing protein [Actinoplanes lichenicola]
MALLVGIVGLAALNAASHSAQLIYRSNLASVEALGQLRAAAIQARVDLANQVLSVADADTEKFTDAVAADLQAVAAAMTVYRASMPAPEPQLIDDLQANWEAYVAVVNER